MFNIKFLTTSILVIFSFFFTACLTDNKESKEQVKSLLTGEPSEKYHMLSQKYFKEGEYRKALKYNIKQLNEDLKYYKKESSEIALDYNDIGLNYDKLKEYTRAIEYYQKAIQIDNIILDDNNTERATTYFNLASSHDALDNYDEALEYYLKALAIDKESKETRSKIDELKKKIK